MEHNTRNQRFVVVPLCAQLLYDTFRAFGMIIATPKIMRDPDTR